MEKRPYDLGLRCHFPVIDPLISQERANNLEGPYPTSVHYSNTNKKTIVLQNSHLGVGSTLWRETGFQIKKMVTFKQRYGILTLKRILLYILQVEQK